jgi:hypothetical protein
VSVRRTSTATLFVGGATAGGRVGLVPRNQKRSRRISLRLLAALVSLTTAGCSDSGSKVLEDEACTSSRIVNGQEVPRLFSLPSDQLRSIVAVLLPSAGGSDWAATCTGVIVAPGFVLTAGHCIDVDRDGHLDHPLAGSAPDATILVASGTNAAPTRHRVDAAWLHPSFDVALLEAQELADASHEAPSLPLQLSPVDATWVGSPMEIAGVGMNESGDVGPLRFAIEPIARIVADYVVVDGMGQSGACVGDSGGPALARSDDGTVRVVGLLDAGDAGCVGEDYYLRIDRLAGWEPMRSNVPTQVNTSKPPCAGLDETGVCLRGHSFSCVDGALVADDCSARGEVCGWSNESAAFRCESATRDPCVGLGSFATCDENGRVVACRDGTIVTADCGACGASCVAWASPSGAACL